MAELYTSNIKDSISLNNKPLKCSTLLAWGLAYSVTIGTITPSYGTETKYQFFGSEFMKSLTFTIKNYDKNKSILTQSNSQFLVKPHDDLALMVITVSFGGLFNNKGGIYFPSAWSASGVSALGNTTCVMPGGTNNNYGSVRRHFPYKITPSSISSSGFYPDVIFCPWIGTFGPCNGGIPCYFMIELWGKMKPEGV